MVEFKTEIDVVDTDNGERAGSIKDVDLPVRYRNLTISIMVIPIDRISLIVTQGRSTNYRVMGTK